MINRLRHLALRSIRHKLIFASIVCIVVPAVISLIVYNGLSREAVKRQAVSNARDSLQLVAGSVTNLLSSKLNIANYIQVNSGLNTYFKQVASGNEEKDPYRRFTEANRVLEQLDSLTVVGEQTYVTVLLTNGAYYMNYSVSDYNPPDLTRQPWFKQMKELRGLESYWTGPERTVYVQDQADHPYQLSIARSLRLANSEIYGYVVVSWVEDQVSGIFDRLSKGNRVLMVDSAGTIVSGPAGQIGGKFVYGELNEGTKPYSIERIDGEKFLVVEQEIPMNGWHLVLMQPYQDAIVDLNAIFSKVFLFEMISFFVFLLLLIVLVRRFTTPLVRLGKVTNAVQRGNLDVRSGVAGNDEIGRLGLLFDQMLDRVKEMIAEVSDHQARKRRAELKMLQAQIHPHFLFNVLNSIRMKVMKRGDPESAKMIGSLSVLLRMTISREDDEILLHEEIDLISHYVALMNLRQKEEAVLQLDIDPEAFLIKVPRFFLQPLVENAMIHGLSREAGTISIRAVTEAERIILTVADDGAGMEEERRQELMRILNGAAYEAESLPSSGSFSGIGLPNVAERMNIMFGDGFQACVNSEPGAGTVIEMHIPRKEGLRDV
ncbi:sensor histidine kinase [Paenibacillus cellulositrophicus]|uniref:sensor histidine kinase n=1 Tax=Paenibacillus cellulositrophicus TaxID=562959 RepID=UPI003F7DD208